MDSDSILIVEDHALLAQAVGAVLADHGVTTRLIDPAELDDVVATVAPGTVVLLDLRLGGGRDGGRAVGPLVERGARVIVVTGTSDPVALGQALQAGALTVVDKRQPFADLVANVLAVRAGDLPTACGRHHEILAAAAERKREQDAAGAVLERLTTRETEVLDQLCDGYSAQEIASSAGVSLTTVRAQIRSVLAKLGVRSQLQAVARAHQLRPLAHGRPGRRPATGGGSGEAAR